MENRLQNRHRRCKNAEMKTHRTKGETAPSSYFFSLMGLPKAGEQKRPESQTSENARKRKKPPNGQGIPW